MIERSTGTLQVSDDAKQRRKNSSKRKSLLKRKRTPARRNLMLLTLTGLLVIGGLFAFCPPQDKIAQGLDIRGGLSVVLQAKPSNGGEISKEDMEQSKSIVERRVNALGASEASVQIQGNDQLLVQIPGITDSAKALDSIGRTGKLEFARVDSFTDKNTKKKIEEGQYGKESVIKDSFGNSFPSDKKESLEVKPGTYKTLATGKNISRVDVDKASESGTDFAVGLTLDMEGAKAFADATRDLVADHGAIAILLDNKVESAPAVQAEITDGKVSITGGYSMDEAKELKTVLESGSLPVSFECLQSQVVGGTVGQDALYAAVIVALIGLGLVMLYLIFFYKGFGLITAASMLIFACFYLGILGLLSAIGMFALSLAGVAGVVLTIGMAADSSVLTIERFREELREGRSVKAASITGVAHAIKTSIDADIVTLVSAMALFFLASASVKGFGLTLAIGIGCDIIMMLLFKAPLIRLLAPRLMKKHPRFWGFDDCLKAGEAYKSLAEAAEVPNLVSLEAGCAVNPTIVYNDVSALKGPAVGEQCKKIFESLKGRFIKKDFPFLAKRFLLLGLAGALVCCSIGLIAFKGLDFGIEFVGGTSIQFIDTGNTSQEQLAASLESQGMGDVVIQPTDTHGKTGYLVKVSGTDSGAISKSVDAIVKELSLDKDSVQVTTIGPDWGAGVVQSSLVALVVSMLAIIAYIALRFEYKMGICAVVALLHDIIIVLGVYALIGKEISPNVVAALLTILGYSLYDTVVVFHRISDNITELGLDCNFLTMANHSVNQVFMRSINTTLTSLIPVLAMMLFGGETLKDFAFAMSIGLVCGACSSITIAVPLYSLWKEREDAFADLKNKFGEMIKTFSFVR